ncbi:unnamed protein product, partial [Closterium sp. Naga37s-1]
SFPWAVAVMGWVLPGDVVRPFMGLAAHATAPPLLLHSPARAHLMPCVLTCAALLQPPGCWVLVPPTLTPSPVLLLPVRAWQCTLMRDPVTLPSGNVVDRPVILTHLLNHPPRVTLGNGRHVARRRELGGPLAVHALLPPAPTAARPPAPPFPPAWSEGGARCMVEVRGAWGEGHSTCNPAGAHSPSIHVHPLPLSLSSRPPAHPLPLSPTPPCLTSLLPFLVRLCLSPSPFPLQARRAAARGAGVAPASCAPPRPLPPRHMLARLPIRHPPFFLSFPRPSFAPPRPSPSHVRTAAAAGGGGEGGGDGGGGSGTVVRRRKRRGVRRRGVTRRPFVFCSARCDLPVHVLAEQACWELGPWLGWAGRRAAKAGSMGTGTGVSGGDMLTCRHGEASQCVKLRWGMRVGASGCDGACEWVRWGMRVGASGCDGACEWVRVGESVLVADEAMSVKTCPLSPLSSLTPPPSTNAPHSILPGTLCCTAAATHTPTSPCCGVTTTRRTRKALAHKALSPPPSTQSSSFLHQRYSARTPAPPASLSRVARCTGVLRARHGDDTHARGVWLSDGEWRALHGVRGTLHGVRGTLHGVRGTLHGVRGTLHGVRGTLHGVRGTLHGVSGTLHGVSGAVHGVSGAVHGVSGAVHGVSGAVHGVSGAVHGVSGAVHGGMVHGCSLRGVGCLEPKGRSACTSRPLASTFPSTHTLLPALFPPAHPPTPVPHTTLRTALLEVLVKAMLRVRMPLPTLATLVRYLALGIMRPAPAGAERGGAGDGGSDTARVHSCHFIYPPPPLSHLLSFPTSSSRTCLVTHLSDFFPACPLPRVPPSPCAPLTACPLSLRPPFHAPPFPCTPLSLRPPPRRQAAQGSAAGGSSPRDSGKAMLARAIAGEAAGVPFVGAPQEAAPCIVFPAGRYRRHVIGGSRNALPRRASSALHFQGDDAGLNQLLVELGWACLCLPRGQVLGLAGQLPQHPCHGSVLHSGGVQGGAGGAVVRSTVHLSYTKASQPTRLAPNPSPTLPPFLASIFPLTQCAQFFPLQSLNLSYSPLLSPSPADVISHPPPLSWLAGR